jgi:hypothetical protein
MEATCSSETLLDFQGTAQRLIPEDKILQVGVRFPVQARKCSLLHDGQIDPWDFPSSYTRCMGGCFLGDRAGYSPTLVLMLGIVELHFHSPTSLHGAMLN